MRSRSIALCVALTAFVAVVPMRATDDTARGASPAAPGVSDNPFGSSDPYQACVAAVGKKADDAFELALTWRDRGGGVLAERCAALALIALDEPGEAASRLNALAQRQDAGTVAQRAALLSQSGNAWLLASQTENAEAAFSAALKLTPRDAELWTDRARARAARQDWANAESDLANALSYDKSHPETYVLRASARQAQGNKAGYKADIDAALGLDPSFPDALAERGAIRMEAGDAAGARADFLQVLVRAPDSPAADSVRLRIQTLEVHDP
jgi:regulator of sirC expression with transglutaminase-like and TPR domain